MQVYALCDTKLGKFYPPTLYQNVTDAKRSIADLLRYAPESMLSRHPEDFVLYQIGNYDDNHGYLIPLVNDDCKPIVELICNVDELNVTKPPKLEVVKNEV